MKRLQTTISSDMLGTTTVRWQVLRGADGMILDTLTPAVWSLLVRTLR